MGNIIMFIANFSEYFDRLKIVKLIFIIFFIFCISFCAAMLRGPMQNIRVVFGSTGRIVVISDDLTKWEKTIINIPGYTKNNTDTHMYWDDKYLWIPEAEFDVDTCSANIISNNLIRYNPLTKEVVNYPLPLLEEQKSIVYEVVPGNNPGTLYVSAPYGKNKAIYIFDKETGNSTMFLPPDMFAGVNGAKMTVTNINNIDYVWTTGLAGKIVKFNAEDKTSQTFDFSEYGGFYGIASVPSDTIDVYTIYACSLTTGNIIIFPSNISDTNEVAVINPGAKLGLSHSVLTSMNYDGTYLWMAIKSNDLKKHGFVRYTPNDNGTYSVYWTNAAYAGSIPTMNDFKGYMWMTVEEFNRAGLFYVSGSKQNPQLVYLNKATLKTGEILLPTFVNLDRAAASLGNDDDSLYIGGYGFNEVGSVLNLLQVTPPSLLMFIEKWMKTKFRMMRTTVSSIIKTSRDG
jgi:hypothetical protein